MRLILLLVAILLPFGLFGLTVGKPAGMALGLLMGIGLLIYWASTAEKTVMESLSDIQAASPGTFHSVSRVTREELGVTTPEVYEVAEAAPNALIARFGGGAGRIILTQGLLASISEEELRVVIRALVLRLRSPLLSRQTFCASLAHRLLEWAPKEWTRFVLAGDSPDVAEPDRLRPLAFLGFLLIYPWARFVIWCGNSAEGGAPPAEFSADELLLWGNAMRKVGGSSQTARFTGQPGLLALYLCPPRPMSDVISLV